MAVCIIIGCHEIFTALLLNLNLCGRILRQVV